jgi:hypothetical protein
MLPLEIVRHLWVSGLVQVQEGLVDALFYYERVFDGLKYRVPSSFIVGLVDIEKDGFASSQVLVPGQL